MSVWIIESASIVVIVILVVPALPARCPCCLYCFGCLELQYAQASVDIILPLVQLSCVVGAGAGIGADAIDTSLRWRRPPE